MNTLTPETDAPKAIVTIQLLRDAQKTLETMFPGIGGKGPTMGELTEAENSGDVYGQDATYHHGQKAWLQIERAINE